VKAHQLISSDGSIKAAASAQHQAWHGGNGVSVMKKRRGWRQ